MRLLFDFTNVLSTSFSDMRLYALVTNFSPLKVFIYRRGFARFTNSRYSSNMQDIYNGFVHLTNVAIQKTAENYDERTGGKMELQALKLFLMSQYGVERIDALFWEVLVLFIRSHFYHLPNPFFFFLSNDAMDRSN